ncbi:ERF family protein [Hymenobacter latericus]|uniref:ERF family protein n=1 Tax=Hymenobacter sp. YIM 151858-1 TaxID=2987688 RepID=UPI002227ABA9|nr:ERF family protein [Hymenobacter sp. YIM 151858-1]UYZ60163.1 ERF family protein [Hymenobacter sp. YIM 151858-1]
MSEQTDTSKNLYQRISGVMQDVRYLQKDKQVSTGAGGPGYSAMSEEKVTEKVREALITHGLVILPVEQDQRLDDLPRGAGKIVSLTTVNTRYKIVNIDNPSEFEYLASSGTGVDSQDKGVGKAMTYAYKYMLLRTFGIATGKDTDDVGNAELERQQEEAAAKALQASKDEVKRLLNHPLVKPEEKQKVLASLDGLNAGQTEKAIAWATKLIDEREAQPA